MTSRKSPARVRFACRKRATLIENPCWIKVIDYLKCSTSFSPSNPLARQQLTELQQLGRSILRQVSDVDGDPPGFVAG